jgi:hypothetical protein
MDPQCEFGYSFQLNDCYQRVFSRFYDPLFTSNRLYKINYK